MLSHYLETNHKNVEDLDLDGEVVVIHDPQPLPLISARLGGKWVWRCHIDMSTPSKKVWMPLRNFVGKYDLSVFSLEKYIPDDLGKTKALVNNPCIDPLSPKNSMLTPDEILRVLDRFEVKPDLPIIGQVARFDKWKDPLGAIDLYRKVREKVPTVQMLLIGSFASDDPEGLEWHRKVVEYSRNDPDIHVLTNKEGVGNLEVNAFQRSFSAALQLSLREGFGLTVSEALWKGVPVVARRAGGIPLQVIDGLTGFLVENLDAGAARVVQLIKMPWLARELGRNGAEHVKKNFLVTKRLKENLAVILFLMF
jgi:trehalose synthase